jgi:uncharacterized membrane protein
MKGMTVITFTLAFAAVGVAWAAAPELSVKKTATIAAPADKVWAATKNFDGLNTWLPALASDEIVSGSNNTAVDAITGVYTAGLDNLKKTLESP